MHRGGGEGEGGGFYHSSCRWNTAVAHRQSRGAMDRTRGGQHISKLCLLCSAISPCIRPDMKLLAELSDQFSCFTENQSEERTDVRVVPHLLRNEFNTRLHDSPTSAPSLGHSSLTSE